MQSRMYLYPLWIRVWHWSNALLFTVLIITGAGMHFSQPDRILIRFEIAVATHNLAGILLMILYCFFFAINIVSGNFKHYIPKPTKLTVRLFNQAKYYLWGIFTGDPHPSHPTPENKFNALQQLTYAGIMYVLMPLLMITGVALLYPELAPDQFLGMGGLWPVAVGHSVLGFFGTLFIVGHIYLATTGNTVTANFKGMLTGWHEHEEDSRLR